MEDRLPGTVSFYYRAPGKGISVIVLCNGANTNSSAQRFIGQSVAEFFAPGSTLLSVRGASDPSPDLTAKARAIVFHGAAAAPIDQFCPEAKFQTMVRGADEAWTPRPSDFSFVRQERLETGIQRHYRFAYDGRVENFLFRYSDDARIYWVSRL